MNQATLGIMTIYTPTNPPFPEKAFFRNIIQAGKAEGISVIVFHPNQVQFDTLTVKGYTLNQHGQWITITIPVPAYIYDRCFYNGRKYNAIYKSSILKLLGQRHIRFLGIGLKGKWQMYQAVSQHPSLSRYLPSTEIYASPSQLKKWLQEYSSIILKPVNGSLGVGVMKVTQKERSCLHVEGRGKGNIPFTTDFTSFPAFLDFLQSNMQKWKYLIQPYLSLSTKEGVPYDLRIMVQKNGSGTWMTTGKAIRMGAKNSITSNLHGGGSAISFKQFSQQHYTSSEAEHINTHLSILETLLPEYLERAHGPLLELGIDVGIDTSRKVWLIEVNSKPGRQIFEQLHDQESIIQSQLNPLYYAKYLMQKA